MKRLIVLLCVLVISILTQHISAQGECYDLNHNYTGYIDFNTPQLQDNACELEAYIVNNSSLEDFTIQSFDLYPTLAYVNGNEGFEYSKQKAKDELTESEFYLGIIKEYKRVNSTTSNIPKEKVIYTLEFSLPDDLDYNPIRVESTIISLQEYLNENSEGIPKSIDEEFLFATLLSSLQQNGSLSIEELEAAGYEYIELESGLEVRSEVVADKSRSVQNDEYAKIEIRENGGEWENILDYNPNVINLYNVLVDVKLGTYNSEVSGSILGQVKKSIDSFLKTNQSNIFLYHSKDILEKINGLWVKLNTKLDEASQEVIAQGVMFENLTNSGMSVSDIQSKIYKDYGQRDSEWAFGKTFMNSSFFEQYLNNPECNNDEECSVNGENVSGLAYGASIACGLFDGLIGSIKTIYDMSAGIVKNTGNIFKRTLNYLKSVVSYGIKEGSFFAMHAKVASDALNSAKKLAQRVVVLYELIVEFADNFDLSKFVNKIMKGLESLWGTFTSFTKEGGYLVGKLVFEVVFLVLTAGSSSAFSGAKYMQKFMTYVHKMDLDSLAGCIMNMLTGAGQKTSKWFKCSILGKGCFVKDTPVLMANPLFKYNLGNKAKAVAMAATMPIVAVPIQEVQLFDYAVAHETVNAGYGLTASTNDDSYLGLLDEDPYTSGQQRERDKYELDNENWSQVVFEEVNGSSTAKLALHNDWINQNAYRVDSVVIMNLPEQGISGPFRITSIKHIIPQKKPTDDDEADDYDYRPVTALFTHVSDEVYNILFDNGESLGVTYQHPIYSVTAGDWRLAGELEAGEKVLTKSGETFVVKSEKSEGEEKVYNLEVKELHNFLVGESGVLVHNTCWLDTDELMRKISGKSYQKEPGLKLKINKSKSKDHEKIKSRYSNAHKDDNGNLLVCFDDYGFPDFGPYAEIIVEIDMNGDSGDFTQAVNQGKELLPGVDLKKSGTVIDNITYTWHHHQDGKSMMLVPKDINNTANGGVAHSGGNTLVKNGYKGENNPFAGAKNPKNSKCK